MTSTPITFDVVKFSELDAIGRDLNGNDELIVNDLLVAPVETKRCTVVELANSIKQYIFPIASDTVLGAVKVGDGLSIDGTGVLSSDLGIVELTSVANNQLLVYSDGKWVNANYPDAVPEMLAGDAIEITGKGTLDETINVKVGQGIQIVNDSVTARLGKGVRIINDQIEVEPNSGINVDTTGVSVKIATPLYFNASGTINLNYGVGLKIDTASQSLQVDTSTVVTQTSGNINASNLALSGGVTASGTSTLSTTIINGSASVNGDLYVSQDIYMTRDMTGRNAQFSGDVTANNIGAFKLALVNAVTASSDFTTLRQAILDAITNL